MKDFKWPLLALLASLPTLPLHALTYDICTTQIVISASGSADVETHWFFEDTVVDGNVGVKLTGVNPEILSEDATLPAVIMGDSSSLTVLEIAEGALANSSFMTSVTIPNQVLKIGDYAFSNCTALASVNLGYGVRYIGKRPFVNTAISEITLPDTLLQMDGNITAGMPYGAKVNISDSSHFAYSDDELLILNKDMTCVYACATRAEGFVEIPSTVTEIKPDAFFGCFRLKCLNIPANVTTIGSSAFNVQGIWSSSFAPESTPRLETVFYQGSNSTLTAVADDIYAGAPETLTNYAFTDDWRSSGSTWKNRALEIKTGAFQTDVFDADYYGVNWKFRLVSDDGLSLYAELWNHETAVIPTSTEASSHFSGDGDVSAGDYLLIPSSLYGFPVNKVGKNAFAGCNVCSLILLPSTVSIITDGAFTGCAAIKQITNSKVDSDGHLNLPDGVETLGKRPFDGLNKVTSLTIPASLKSMDGNPIVGCNYLTEITVSEANRYFCFETPFLMSADRSKIYACIPTVTAVTIPETVTEIAEFAFDNCDVLKTIAFENPITNSIPADLFDKLPSVVVTVDINKYDQWQPLLSTAPWKALNESGRFITTGTPTPSGDAERAYTDETTSITWRYRILNESYAVITGLSNDFDPVDTLTVPDRLGGYFVLKIADSAFKDNIAFDEISLPTRCTTLGKAPFTGTNLSKLELPKTLQTLDGNPLAGCAYVTDISVDAANPFFSAADGVLYDKNKSTLLAAVPSLAALTVPATVTKIADDAFAGCTQLRSLTFLGSEPTAADAVLADTPASLVVSADAYLTSWGEPIPTIWKGRSFKNIGVTPPEAPEGIQVTTDANGNTWTYEVVDRRAVLGRTLTALLPTTDGAVVIPEALDSWPVAEIGEKGFVDCVSLTSIEIPATVTTIAPGAFNGCKDLSAFTVSATNTAFKSRNGILYSKDGTTLVKVPAAFRFATTITESVVTCQQETIRTINGFDSSTMQRLPDTITTKTTDRTTDLVTVDFKPAIGLDSLFAGVTTIGAYAFTDCGWLPAGSTVIGTVTISTNAVVGSTRTGKIVMDVGTDSTGSEIVTNTVSTKSGITDGKVTSTKTQTLYASTYESSVPTPSVPASVTSVAPNAWVRSIWEGRAETGRTEPVSLVSGSLASFPDAGETSEDDETFSASEISTDDVITFPGGVKRIVETGLDSTTVKSVTVKGLPSGIRLVKTTDRTTKISTWTLQGTPTKAASKTVTLTVVYKDKTKETITFTIEAEATPAWLAGEFNGPIFAADTSDPIGYATAKITTAGRVTGKLSMPSADGTKAKSYSFTLANFSDSGDDGEYIGSTTIRIGTTKKEVVIRCRPADDGTDTGLLTVDLDEDGFAELYQNIWKRTDLSAPNDLLNQKITQDGISFQIKAKGKVIWSGSVTGDDGKSVKVSGTTQLFNDGRSTVIYAPPKRNLVGGRTAEVEF